MKVHPKVLDEEKVGTYPALAKAGGGYVWDEVLEYRVWCHPERGASDLENGNDYYYAFKDYQSALSFTKENKGTEEPLALVLQREYIDEPQPGQYIHIKEERITEWPVQFLSRPKRSKNTLLNFFSPNAPANRLDIIRGLKEEASFQHEEIFLSEVNEHLERAIVIDGDQHTIWAYCLKKVNDKQELLFDGFICSRGTVVKNSQEVKNFIDNDLQPPLMDKYVNEYSIHQSLCSEDFKIEWNNASYMIKIFINDILYLVMDINKGISYSKSILKEGPYGRTINEYINR